MSKDRKINIYALDETALINLHELLSSQNDTFYSSTNAKLIEGIELHLYSKYGNDIKTD